VLAKINRRTPALLANSAIIRVAGGVEAARLQERQLHAEGRHTYVLDAATVKNAEEIAAILVDAGLIVLLANGR